MRFPVIGGVLAALVGGGFSLGQAQGKSLGDLSLEELSNVVISSVSRREQPLSAAPASVYVISGEDIRRSGALTIADALQLAPNLHVARVADLTRHAISARGFNNSVTNKLLVLIDGRTVYSPFFSGVFWDAQDVMLEDVERIEVVSGPGGTLWGTNAVNGVINITTRRADATQGTLAVASAGGRTRQAVVRHGGRLAGGHYRVYGRTTGHARTSLADGQPSRDAGDLTQAGFRMDWGAPADGFTLQGDAYGAGYDEVPQAKELSGMNLLGRWTKALAGGGALRVQGYVERKRRVHLGVLHDELDTMDLEAVHALAPIGSHRIQWGVGARRHRDEAFIDDLSALLPRVRTWTQTSLFAQDDIALRPDLNVTLGARIETNPYTGAELLPNARLAWTLSPSRMLWTALSRSVRAPTRLERDIFSPPTPPFTVLAGGPDFRSEVATVLELGYRAQPLPQLSYSLTGFYGRYQRLRTATVTPAGPVFSNEASGHLKGIEGWASWRARPWLRLSAGATAMSKKLGLSPGAVNLLAADANGNDPDGWLKLRASIDLGPRHQLDLMLRRVGALPAPAVPAYTALDARLGWQLTREVELALVAQNLGDPGHPEFGLPALRPEVPRSVFLTLRLALD